MKKWLAIFVIVLSLLTGCEDEVDTLDNGVMPEIVDVTIETPEQLQPNTPITLKVYVEQGGEPVDDADEVLFEVWESGYSDKSVKVTASHEGNGRYIATYTFDHQGVFYMYAHTTARNLHIMPKQQLIVGKPDMNNVKEDDHTGSMEHKH